MVEQLAFICVCRHVAIIAIICILEPASPEYSVTRQINELKLDWDRPDGHFEGYVMTFDGGNVINSF